MSTGHAEGIEALFAPAREQLEARLSAYRFLHSLSVADTAQAMAISYGVHPQKAWLAGLLHDWDKDLTDEELLARVKEFDIPLVARLEDMAMLLHAQTGAVAVARAFPELGGDIIQAIARHTSAAPDMSDLDMVIYVADMIEPLRSQGNLTSLRASVGKVSLETLFLRSFEMTMDHLIRRHRFIHPDSLEVWNTYIARERAGN
ncbi:MAG: bis(5'-nucleosyl)-tetraphosphatase (symmetrical) YqeK [Coriobacteriales bacterium]|jgi:predicted HD superfamily hydrolase involved in NAD metabolism|nr:bis(5'-nucleosyl)-tetraphosphatase (symmetrical) YqeK [Coriobacteriales bacterium]